MSKVSTVEIIKPPMTTVANGRCTSAPAEVAIAIGTNPKDASSEAVINCLRPYIGTENVVVIGETTVGKNVAMEPYQDERYNFILWPVVAYVLNSAGQANYVNGITPDFTLSERNLISPLYPLGDTKEYLLKNTIAYITTGSMPDLPQTEEQVSKGKIIYNSLIRRSMNGIRLR